MSKVLIIGDTHLGIKNFSIEYFEKNQLPFLKQCIQYCVDNNISHIIQLGDLFDHRVSTNNVFLSKVQIFFHELEKNNITFHTLLGNHDISLLQSREYSLSEIISNLYDNIILYKEQTLIDLYDKKLFFVPWLIKNEGIDIDYLTEADYVFGHFEINSFKIMNNIIEQSGLDLKIFKLKNIKYVFSGHFHNYQKKMNVIYTGTPYQLTWGEYKNKPRVFILDLETNKYVTFENKISNRHIKIKCQKDNIIISGLNKDVIFNYDIINSESKQNELFKILKNNNIKVFINEDIDNIDDFLYLLYINKIDYTLTDNVLLSKMIGNNYNSNINIIDPVDYITNNFQGKELEIVLDIIKQYKEDVNEN